uniref:START domain-containing protein 10 n=1 Tax=Anolis carolinensis TaxID=28377 RepID=H9GKH0_ANOCA
MLWNHGICSLDYFWVITLLAEGFWEYLSKRKSVLGRTRIVVFSPFCTLNRVNNNNDDDNNNNNNNNNRLSLLMGPFLPVSLQCRMDCKDLSAETLYDVLHDIEYRKKWDTNVIETFDIGKLTVNADVGYYSWRCPKPLKNRDVITLRSWLPMGSDYIIMNYSVKHPKYPPRKDMVRAVSIQTGYLIQGKGAKNCTLTYLAQVDPKGESDPSTLWPYSGLISLQLPWLNAIQSWAEKAL